ncbi:MAG: response regulator [Tildeniella nuda ZEHNDER 1965/U140]|jgi:hypothetical protein|nr:response regulator [Tildeniella nuda ZEHNDER 1965/U140]
MHQYSNEFEQANTPMATISTNAECLVPEVPPDVSPETTAAWATPSVPDASKAAIQQLVMELQSERCLNRLGQRLNACVSEYLAAVDRDATVSHVSVPPAQILAEELSLGLNQSCAVVLPSIEAVSDRGEPTAHSLESVFTVYVIASGHAKPAPGESCLASAMPLMPFTLGQSLSDRDLQCWRTQFPACAWQIHNGQVILGWLLLSPIAADFQPDTLNVLDPLASLKARLIEQSLDRYLAALCQVEQIQAQAQQREALAAHNHELQQANHLKSEFLANTSHEIRTPLSSILGFTHLMREQGFNPSSLKHQEYLNIILSSGQHLLALINDILDLSKIEANQLDLHWEIVAIKSVCQTAIALVKEKANDKGLSLTLEIAPQVDTLVADPLRLKQMLFNLLSNALKFTRQGSVGLQVTVADDLHFTVWDTGTGISEDQQQLLFRPYSQIANAAAKRDEGTGLGLALTQKLAELHGGRVEIHSQLGQGSRFTIVLPLIPITENDAEVNVKAGELEAVETVQAAPYVGETLPARDHPRSMTQTTKSARLPANPHVRSASDKQPPLPTVNIPTRSNHLLLVEDNTYNAKLMLTYLSKLGYEVTWVKDGIEMRQALARALPALILMDIHLPGEDGIALTHQLKADDRYCSIPIIAQTAMAMSGDRDLCLEAGTVAYISKPIDLKLLAQLIAQYVKGIKE